MKLTIGLALWAVLIAGAPAGAHNVEGRWVDFGKWNGVVDCESSPVGTAYVPAHHPVKARAEVRVDQVSWTWDYGGFQFQRNTWDNVAQRRGKTHLIGKDPRTVTLAQQIRQAQWLRKNVGIWQWSCGYRYGDGTGPRFVTGEWKLPSNPEGCARNLDLYHGVRTRVARSVCNAD